MSGGNGLGWQCHNIWSPSDQWITLTRLFCYGVTDIYIWAGALWIIQQLFMSVLIELSCINGKVEACISIARLQVPLI